MKLNPGIIQKSQTCCKEATGRAQFSSWY